MALLAAAVLAAGIALAGAAHACASHGTLAGNDIQHWLLGDLDGDGLLEAFVGIEDEIVPPDGSTTCVCGIGLGTTGSALPAGSGVTGAHVAVLDLSTRRLSDLPAFGFAANPTTTAALELGAGPGGPPDGDPLFAGSSWFGFSADVGAFTLPSLAADEILVLSFDLELPASALPLSIDAQFAAGEGGPDGTPLFSGPHPTRYFSVGNPQLFFAPEARAAALALAAAALLGWRRRERRSRSQAGDAMGRGAVARSALEAPSGRRGGGPGWYRGGAATRGR